MQFRPNAHHSTLIANELIGVAKIETRGVPVLSGGQPVELEGKKGVFSANTNGRSMLVGIMAILALSCVALPEFSREYRTSCSGLRPYFDGRRPKHQRFSGYGVRRGITGEDAIMMEPGVPAFVGKQAIRPAARKSIERNGSSPATPSQRRF
jgi:hypothetical protein